MTCDARLTLLLQTNIYLKDITPLSDSHVNAFTSFALYTFGFIIFVLSLQTGLYKYKQS